MSMEQHIHRRHAPEGVGPAVATLVLFVAAAAIAALGTFGFSFVFQIR